MFLAGALGKVLIMHTLVFVIGGYFICSILVSNCDGEVTYFVILGYRYFGMLAMFSLHLAADLTCPWRSRPRCVTWSRLRSLQFGQTCHAPGRRPRVTSLSQSRPRAKIVPGAKIGAVWHDPLSGRARRSRVTWLATLPSPVQSAKSVAPRAAGQVWPHWVSYSPG